MPELPDVEVYVEALNARVQGRPLEKIRLGSPFVLRTVRPTPSDCEGRKVERVHRMGKRLVFGLEGDHHLVVHLMIAGRFRWEAPGVKLQRKTGLFAWDFAEGSLVLTEAGSKKRASLHVVEGAEALKQFDRGGLEVLEASTEEFSEALLRENRTLKRALTDPRIFSGIGNAYSDEILHAARLSPVTWTSRLDAEERERLFEATVKVLRSWTERLRVEAGDGFPKKVTAFREGMAVHGRHREPCPDCGSPVQRIRYADNKTNYCAGCQTGGKLLKDRSLSLLLKKDWPKTLDELEELGK